MVTAVCDIIAAVVSLHGCDVFRLNGGGRVCAVAMVTRVAVCDGLGGGEGAGVQETAAKYTCREKKKLSESANHIAGLITPKQLSQSQ